MKHIIDINCYSYKIGQNLARIRKSNGLSQADMEQYGISRAYYGRLELGLHNLTLDKMRLISYAFGVNPSSLFKDENGKEII